MIHNKPHINELLSQARQEPDKLDQLFSWYRPYLRFRALSDYRIKRLGSKLDGSDIAQEALRKAYVAFEKFEGDSEPQLTSWMHVILLRTIEDAVRKFLGPTRDVRREQSLNVSANATESATLVFNEPVAGDMSVQSRVIQGESALHVAKLIADLPDTQAEAVRLRHLERMPLKEIAIRMDKSESAIAGLLKRGTAKLREAMQRSEG
ncbi:MAG: sigma-70 family RNA polymerase sigma factor [Planctomycetota bacterium]